MKHLVVHIVDDASWGGVNRLLDCLEQAHELTHDQHKIVRVVRGARKAPIISADVIVSHMSICWKNLPFFSSLRAANPETPLVHVEHSYSEHYAALKAKSADRFDDLLTLTYSLFDKVVAVSRPQAQWIARRQFCQPEQLVTISSCVSLAPFLAVARPKPGSAPKKLGCIGRFHEQKGFDILIDAFIAANPENLQLVLIGDGPMKEALMKKASGNANIVFKPSTNIPALAMAECDAVAMPSRWEPYGLVALEAMAAGRPVFCSRVDGLNQHITNGATAVAQNTVEGWQSLLSSGLVQKNVKTARQLAGIAGSEWTFINAWNQLVFQLTRNEGDSHMAA